MLAYERLQTIIGREITGDELSMVAKILKTSTRLFFQEESTKPWIVEPEPIDFLVEIDDIELIEKIFEKANEMDISSHEFVNRIVKEYVNSLSPAIMSEEPIVNIIPNREIGRKYKIVDFQGCVCWAKLDAEIYAVDPLYLTKFKELFSHFNLMEMI